MARDKSSSLRLLLTICALTAVLAAAGTSVPVFPSPAKKIVVVVKTKERTYFNIEKARPCVVKLDGPGKLTIITRLAIPQRDTGSASYSLAVREGKLIVKDYTTHTTASEAHFTGLPFIPGKSRKFSLDIPTGAHTYEFILKDRPLAALRFLFRKTTEDDAVNLEALSYDRTVTAVVKEKLITYYVASTSKAVSIKVIGPTRLQIMSRLNFESAMTGKQGYALAIAEGTRQVTRQKFSTTKSMAAYYRELKDVVAGKPVTSFIEIPAGEHTYHVALEETSAKSVALKFSIPRVDLDKTGDSND